MDYIQTRSRSEELPIPMFYQEYLHNYIPMNALSYRIFHQIDHPLQF